MKDNVTVAKEYTEWHTKTGGFARDMTLRDYIAAKVIQERAHEGWDDEELARLGYQTADAVLKERAK
jgi:hypothetical protein